jgi:uncharacterized protein (DUF952 family)
MRRRAAISEAPVPESSLDARSCSRFRLRIIDGGFPRRCRYVGAMPVSARSDEFPSGATTQHLLPVETWINSRNQATYAPDAFAADGFVHCTNGDDELIAVGNRFYRGDPRDYLVLTIAIDKLTSPIRYDDVNRVFPHIYGPINREAIVAARAVNRSPDGSFMSISSQETPL